MEAELKAYLENVLERFLKNEGIIFWLELTVKFLKKSGSGSVSFFNLIISKKEFIWYVPDNLNDDT